MREGEAGLWHELEGSKQERSSAASAPAGAMDAVHTSAASLVLLPLTCVTEYGPNEAWRLAGGE